MQLSTCVNRVLPSGSYWIGDPIYLFPKTGEKAFELQLFHSKLNSVQSHSLFTYDADIIHIVTSLIHPGTFLDFDGLCYDSISGFLGIATIETVYYLNPHLDILHFLGNFVEFKDSFLVSVSKDYLQFGTVKIQLQSQVLKT